MNGTIKQPHSYYSAILFYGIHFYFISFFEVIFYIYYILPYEQQLMAGLFNFNLNKSNSFIDKYNITIHASNLYDSEHCQKDANRIHEANNHLYLYCFYYIGFIHVCLISLLFYDIYRTFKLELSATPIILLKKQTMQVNNKLVKNKFSFSSVDIEENVIEPQNLKIEEKANAEETINRNKQEICTFFYYWNHSKFIAEFIRSIYFILFIGVFEYLFFTLIVNQFKIFDLKMVICNLLLDNN